VPVGWAIISALKARVAAVAAIETIPSARVVQLLTAPEAANLSADDPSSWPPLPADGDMDDVAVYNGRGGRPEVGGLVYLDVAAAATPPGAGAEGATDPPPPPPRRAVLADAVVLTTGGYCAPGNPVLAAHAAATAAGLPSTNAPLATGDGVRLAARLGAGTVDLDAVQVHPTGFVPLASASVPPTVFLAPEALRGCGGVLTDAAGRRFVNELEARDVVTAAMRAAAATSR